METFRHSGAERRRMRVAGLAAALAVLMAVGMLQAIADTFSSPATGTHQVIGQILDRYRALGGPAGVLGYPTTDERATPRVYGRYNHFQYGSIYWTPATGAHQIGGSIRDRWAALGWENSPLGFPITDERPTPNLQGRYNHFQAGSIYWSPATGAHSVHGQIRDRWASLGWENSALGFPTSDEYAVIGGRAQDFRYGRITWTPRGGAVVVGAAKAGGGLVPLGVIPPGTQLITVVAPSAGSTTATLTAWEKRAGGWTAVLGPIPAKVGSAGVGAASETTSRTPAGTFPLTEAFGRLNSPGTALPYRVIDASDWWVSDVASAQYNRYYRCAPGTCPFNERAGERLTSAGAAYDHAVVIDYNRQPVMHGAGSAFFLHVTNGAPTAGCVAVDGPSLTSLLRWLTPAARPVIAIGIG